MPRKPRMYLPNVPAHIVQRGNNRDPAFFSGEDYRFYLDCLARALRRYHVHLHAYVLMTNHVHLLLTPESEEGISKVMSLLGQQYVMYINHTFLLAELTAHSGLIKRDLIRGSLSSLSSMIKNNIDNYQNNSRHTRKPTQNIFPHDQCSC